MLHQQGNTGDNKHEKMLNTVNHLGNVHENHRV